ncbi:MAG: prepilin-type N-terminal cleavage/methylation domain-containing protein [Sumerlaeia bacterium]
MRFFAGSLNPANNRCIGRKGFTLIEVLVGLVILLTGIIGIVQLFPQSLKANQEAELRGAAIMLAQQKVEELRRDGDALNMIVNQVQALNTPTVPISWPLDPRLTYSYSGMSLIDPDNDPGDPRDDPFVARIIVRLAADYDPEQRVIYELRFGTI